MKLTLYLPLLYEALYDQSTGCQQHSIWHCQYMAYGTVAVYIGTQVVAAVYINPDSYLGDARPGELLHGLIGMVVTQSPQALHHYHVKLHVVLKPMQ